MKISENETVNFEETAPLDSRFFAPQPVPWRVQFGALSHRGNVRHNNEDHFAVIRRKRSREVLLTNMPPDDLALRDDESYVMIVADGMGGAAFGELASRLALKAADELVGSAGYWITQLHEIGTRQTQDRIQAYADVIHQTLLEYGHLDPRLSGMGTTLTCAHVLGDDVIIAHVGDSRAYHFHGGQIQQITRDQTLAQELLDAGMPREATVRFRHILTNCLGGDARAVQMDVYHLRLDEGDALLLCSDGLSDLLDDPELAQVLEFYATAQGACERLLRMALDRGGKDNITVVVGRFQAAADRAAAVESQRDLDAAYGGN
ncbi:MAG: serine/threonine-protein phosphatase [Candidatus Anammoximicrobium sp.]|nr:serine/threonine-protein phosphatase [Candidatus Anammoximicrobium sp.]